MNSLKVLGIDLFSIGVVEPEGAGSHVVDRETDGQYLRFVLRENRLVGAILLGDVGPAAAVKKAIESSVDLGRILKTRPRAVDIMAELQSLAT